MIAVEQGEETGLSSCGSLNTAESEIRPRALQVSKIPEKFLGLCSELEDPWGPPWDQSYLYPESSPLSNCGDLRRLEMGESKGRKITILFSEFWETINNNSELVDEKG